MRTDATIALVALASGLGLAQACGPDWPLMLTECRATCLAQVKATGFAFDVNLLRPAAATAPPAVDNGLPGGGGAWLDLYRDEAHAQLAAMRAASTGAGAYALGEGVAEIKRLYAAGAVDFNRVHQAREWGDVRAPEVLDADGQSALDAGLTSAIGWFERAAALPPDASEPRAVAATFMLGRSFDLRRRPGDEDRAIDAYRKTLALVEAGSADPLGLGNAALGELARIALSHRRYDEAIGLYARQSAQEHPLHAIESLWRVARELSEREDELANVIAEPGVQKLLIAFALATADRTCTSLLDCGDRFSRGTPRLPAGSAHVLAALEKLPLKSIQWPDQVAAIAYAFGDFEGAARYAAVADTPYADWIRGKLALRAGDSESAARAFARAVKGAAAGAGALDAGVFARLRGESALVSLSRRDYIDALYQLSQAEESRDDALYVAERVLTIDELKAVVDHDDWAKPYRDLLARRLARSDRWSEALDYYAAPEVRADALALADARRRAASDSAAARAAGLYHQASLEIAGGMALIGTERCPDFAEYQGGFGDSCAAIARDEFKTQSGAPLALVSDDEIERAASAVPSPNVRFHYRALAVLHLLSAADALPRHSVALSAVLCNGVAWLQNHGRSHNEELIQSLYARYKLDGRAAPWAKNFGTDCPEPSFSTPLR